MLRQVRRLGISCLAGLLWVGGNAHAQTGTLRGRVVDSAGGPISGVEVSIARLGRAVRTDSMGLATFKGLSAGDIDLSIRHLGYQAQARHLRVRGAGVDSFKVMLTSQVVSIDEMNVSAIGQHPFFAGFDQRRKLGIGTFITRDAIDASNSTTPSDVFRQLPQVQLVRAGAGMGVRFPTSLTSISKVSSIRRGISSSELCAPMIWIDGQRAPGMEIDDLNSRDIQAIEMYRGVATTPPQFASGGAVPCGAIVVWTRRKG